jgi:hypothetical protein
MSQSILIPLYRLYDVNIDNQICHPTEGVTEINIDLKFIPKRVNAHSPSTVLMSRSFIISKDENEYKDGGYTISDEDTIPCVKYASAYLYFKFYCRELALQEFKKILKKVEKTKKIS